MSGRRSMAEKSRSPSLTFGANASLPAEFVTLLVPLKEIREIPGKLTRVATQVAAIPVEAYVYSTTTEEHSFFFADTGTAMESRQIR